MFTCSPTLSVCHLVVAMDSGVQRVNKTAVAGDEGDESGESEPK